MRKKRIILIDVSSLAYRAFYALPPLTTKQGIQTNAAYGFTLMLLRLIEDESPDFMAAAFDMKGPTFRHLEYEKYKANRDKTPDELEPQFDMIEKILKAYQIPLYRHPEYEADDVLGTIAKEAVKEDFRAVIVSGDRDVLQLVEDDIEVLYTKKGITDIVRYNPVKVKEDHGVTPCKLIDMKGLMGDSSDNIPGVPGIGEKTALKLLKEFDSIDRILNNIEEISGAKRRENLEKYSDQALLSRDLVKIRTDLPLDLDFNNCRFDDPEEDKLRKVFLDLEFKNILKRITSGAEIDVKEEEYKLIKNKAELKKLITEIEEEGTATFSIQTAIQRGEKALIGAAFCCKPGEAYYIPFKSLRLGDMVFDPSEIQCILEDEGINLNVYQAKETILLLYKNHSIWPEGICFDPRLGSYLLNPTSGENTLKEMALEMLDIKMPNSEDLIEDNSSGDLLDLEVDKISDLLSAQTDISHRLFNKLKEELKAGGLWSLVSEIEVPLIPVLAQMELSGIKLDLEKLRDLGQRFADRLEKLTEEIYDLAGEEFNINSPQQLGKVLFEKLELPVVRRTKTGYSTAADVLEELKDKNPVPQKVLKYRQLSKLKSTYIDALEDLADPDTKRLHTSFNQTVTATGRLSSTEPNLQNIPVRTEIGREIRSLFIPDSKEKVLLAIDYSQIELRVLAHISKDPELLRAFNEGEDIHTLTAAEIFDVDLEDVDQKMRRRAKAVNFGIAYGLSAYGLSEDLDISRKEAERYIDTYFNRYSGVKEYMEKTVERAREMGYVETLFNRRRYLPEINSRNYSRRSFAERTAINTPIQGTAADIIKIAMVEIYNRLKELNLQEIMLLQVHDELIFELYRERLKELASMIKIEMESAVELDIPLTVDLKYGENWRDTSPLSV